MHRERHRFARPLALLAALGVVSLSTLGPTQSATAATPSLPDGTKTATLHIVKEEAPATAVPGNGTQNDPGNAPIAGVGFTIKRVNTINLTTNAGWASSNTLSTQYATAAPTSVSAAESVITTNGYTLSAGQTGTTAANGTVTFANLPLGLYLVEETSVPAGVTAAAPFLVTLPMTDPTTPTTWMYDVYAYPKNARTGVTKTVTDATATKIGDPVTWTVTGGIPASTGSGSTVDGYKITDTIDSRLTYSTSTPATASLSNGTALISGTDYTVTYTGGVLSIEFTPAGLVKLQANRSANVVVTIPTVANAVGEISNSATLYPNKAAVDSVSGVTTTPVTTKWGSFTVKKTNPGGTALAGASFKVYPSLSDAQNGTNAITIGATSTWTTAADGTLTVDGLRYSGWADGVAVTSGQPGWRDYYLVETQAPSGYELLAEPIKFEVNATTSVVGVDLTVKNVPSNSGFPLPLTGGVGSNLVYLAGALLVTGGVVLSTGRRRRRA